MCAGILGGPLVAPDGASSLSNNPSGATSPAAPVLAAAAPHRVCGVATELTGPASPPHGAVTVPSGSDAGLKLDAPHTTYWFAPGVHTLGSGKYTQIAPRSYDTYVGAPGAVLDGQGLNLYAFTQHAAHVTIVYLTIKDFGSGTDNATQGVVNHTSAATWTIEHNTITSDAGAGVELGTRDVLSRNCLEDNTQYGFSAYSTRGVSHLTVKGNEVAHNATHDWDITRPGCGCSGGAKFWETRGAVVTGNYVHDNLNVGLWVDTNNSGFDISNNYIANNSAEGIIYEISYNAKISGNILEDNGWVKGEQPTLGFPESAIYISESGGDRRVPGPYSGTLSITRNRFVNNWGGVVLWENSNRFCGNGTSGQCTLVDPSRITAKSCASHLDRGNPRAGPDYFERCRWKTQNVTVSDNTFVFTPHHTGTHCSLLTACGFNGVFSEYGTSPPYQGWVVSKDISDNQHDVFSHNRYQGPWRFDGFSLGTRFTWLQWTHGVADAAGSGDPFKGQDAGSTYRP